MDETRRIKVIVASTKKTPNKISQDQIGIPVFDELVNAIAPSKKPTDNDPISPIKIFAGGQFQIKKPAQAAPSMTLMVAASCAPENQQNTAIENETNIASTPARPSMPSMKL